MNGMLDPLAVREAAAVAPPSASARLREDWAEWDADHESHSAGSGSSGKPDNGPQNTKEFLSKISSLKPGETYTHPQSGIQLGYIPNPHYAPGKGNSKNTYYYGAPGSQLSYALGSKEIAADFAIRAHNSAMRNP